eukprot:TRINITY_DN7927_c0_g1_i1.p1 TRINITY_DN7927_c0_g1~~TRINITY_DN7927_c0_g1_i1.p1  ORF type:complete len:148 (-),score=24.17 TRINITY_DN7927_c0_g1_i1:247-690(-)
MKSPTVRRMMLACVIGLGLGTLVYILQAAITYASFRDDTNQDILNNFGTSMGKSSGLNLPSPLPEVVQVSFVLANLLTFPLMLFECREIVDDLVFGGSKSYIQIRTFCEAAILTFLAALLAILIPDVSVVVAFVGATASPSSLLCVA